jgi:hypothetical protein
MTNFWTDAAVIHSYSRREAIEDGVLVDLMQDETAAAVREAGFTIPVAMTAAAFSLAVWPIDDGKAEAWLKARCQDLQGRLWDVLYMLSQAVRRGGSGDLIRYRIVCLDHASKRRRTIELKAVYGPADDGSPCITVMLPDED